MTSNGKRHPRRLAIELIAPTATHEEAAAIAAALERFLQDTASPPPPARKAESGWGRAALAEGVGLGATAPWGDAPGWI